MKTEKEIIEKMEEVLGELKKKLACCGSVDKNLVLAVHSLVLKSLGWCLGIGEKEWDVETIVELNE